MLPFLAVFRESGYGRSPAGLAARGAVYPGLDARAAVPGVIIAAIARGAANFRSGLDQRSIPEANLRTGCVALRFRARRAPALRRGIVVAHIAPAAGMRPRLRPVAKANIRTLVAA